MAISLVLVPGTNLQAIRVCYVLGLGPRGHTAQTYPR